MSDPWHDGVIVETTRQPVYGDFVRINHGLCNVGKIGIVVHVWGNQCSVKFPLEKSDATWAYRASALTVIL